MRKEQLDNLTKGSRPSLHPCTPNWQTLKGLVARAKDSIADASKKTNSTPTRFAAAHSAAFWLARAALEACGRPPVGAREAGLAGVTAIARCNLRLSPLRHGRPLLTFASVNVGPRARHPDGDCPVQRRNARVKQLSAENPSKWVTSLMLYLRELK